MCCFTLQVRQPLYRSSVDRWKIYKQQLATLEKRLSPMLTKYEQQMKELHQRTSDTSRAASSGTVTAQAQDLSFDVAADQMRDEL